MPRVQGVGSFVKDFVFWGSAATAYAAYEPLQNFAEGPQH